MVDATLTAKTTKTTWDTVGISGSNIAYGTASYASEYVCKTDFEMLSKRIESITKIPEVRPDTTTKLDIKNGKIFVRHYKDGFFKSERSVISDIKNVEVYNKTALVTFADNTKTVAVLDSEDTFSLEQGISICITKKLLGENGGSVYNKLIKRALKVKKDNEKAAEKAEKAKEEAKRKKEASRIRHEKKQLKKREKEIETYKEAIIRAAECLGKNGRKKFLRNFKKPIDIVKDV